MEERDASIFFFSFRCGREMMCGEREHEEGNGGDERYEEGDSLKRVIQAERASTICTDKT